MSVNSLWDDFATEVVTEAPRASVYHRILTELEDSLDGRSRSLKAAVLVELARLGNVEPEEAISYAQEIALSTSDVSDRFRYLYGSFMLGRHERVLAEDVTALADELYRCSLYDDALYSLTYLTSSLAHLDRYAEALVSANELRSRISRAESELDYRSEIRYSTSPLIYQVEQKAVSDPVWASVIEVLRRDTDHTYWEVV